MFFELSKLLNIFVISPISWMFILLIVGYFLRKKKAIKISCWAGTLIIFFVFGNGTLYDRVMNQSTQQYAKHELDKPHYSMAIVMGGFGCMNPENGQFQGNQKADRLWETLRLYKNGKIDRILITGDATILLEKDSSSTARQFLDYMNDIGIADSVFVLEQKARNTHENAVYTKAILKEMNIPPDSCILVTSAEHIDRSLKCFAKEGLELDYYPTGIEAKPTGHFTIRTLYPSWETMVKWQSLFNEWIGDVAYKVMGYI